MRATILVTKTPYVTIADESGAVRISGARADVTLL
jgi:hypothetical protein